MNDGKQHNQTVDAPSKENCACVVVTYKPDSLLPNRVERIYKQTDLTVIVNNGPKSDIDNLITVVSHPDKNIKIIQNSKNMGLGYALNQGVKHCIQSGHKWALLLDQDTEVNSDIVETLIGLTANLSPLPAVIGCNYVDGSSGQAFISYSESESFAIKRKTVITSGSLLNLQAYSIIGPFRDDFFIDSIDHEYCLRARNMGFTVAISNRPLMTHTIGYGYTTDSNLERIMRAPEHSPARKYYITRNSILTIKKYWTSEIAWSFKQLLRLLYEATSVVIFEDNKREKLSSMKRGLVDGVLNKLTPGQLEQ